METMEQFIVECNEGIDKIQSRILAQFYKRDHYLKRIHSVYVTLLLKELWDLRTKVLYAGKKPYLNEFADSVNRKFEEHRHTMSNQAREWNTTQGLPIFPSSRMHTLIESMSQEGDQDNITIHTGASWTSSKVCLSRITFKQGSSLLYCLQRTNQNSALQTEASAIFLALSMARQKGEMNRYMLRLRCLCLGN